jgi:putative hemolysin
MTWFQLEVVIFFVALATAAMFAFLETSFTALRLFKLKELERGFSKYKTLFASWEKNPQRILITILIGNNFAHVVSSVLISDIIQRFLGHFGIIIGVAFATVLILIFGEILPKSLAKTHHEKLFIASLRLVAVLYHILYPVVTLLLKMAKLFFQIFGGVHVLENQETVSEKEIEFLIDYSDEKGLMEAEKTEMLQNIFDLGQTPVHKIMIPKTDIVLLDINSNIEKTTERFFKYRFSRLPLYDGKEDNVVGILYLRDLFDLFYKNQKKTLKELSRPILFVPATKKINQLLSEFLKKRMHMAIVVDEYGGIVGLVTLEDIIEEIVGDIKDEDEAVSTEIVSLEQGGWLINGGTNLDDVAELLDISFEVEDSVTLAGFLSEQLQHLPRKGERVLYSGYCFQVQQTSSTRVLQVLVFKDEEEDKVTKSEKSE